MEKYEKHGLEFVPAVVFVLNGGVRFNGSYSTISYGFGIQIVAINQCLDNDANCNGSKLLSSFYNRTSASFSEMFSWTASPFHENLNGAWGMHCSGSIGNRTVLDIRTQRPALSYAKIHRKDDEIRCIQRSKK